MGDQVSLNDDLGAGGICTTDHIIGGCGDSCACLQCQRDTGRNDQIACEGVIARRKGEILEEFSVEDVGDLGGPLEGTEIDAVDAGFSGGRAIVQAEVIGRFVDEEGVIDGGIGAIDTFVGDARGVPDQVVFAGGHIGGAAVVEICAGGVVFGDDVVLDGDGTAAGTDVCVKAVIGVEGDSVVVEEGFARSAGGRDVDGVGAGVSVHKRIAHREFCVVGVDAVAVAVDVGASECGDGACGGVQGVLCGVGDLGIGGGGGAVVFEIDALLRVP